MCSRVLDLINKCAFAYYEEHDCAHQMVPLHNKQINVVSVYNLIVVFVVLYKDILSVLSVN